MIPTVFSKFSVNHIRKHRKDEHFIKTSLRKFSYYQNSNPTENNDNSE